MILKQGNCLDLIRCVDNSSIDMCLTSPPYDNLRNYAGITLKDVYDLACELKRVLKDGGVVVWVVCDSVVNGSETCTSFRQALTFVEVGFKLHDTMIYQKSGIPLSHRRYEQHFEYMFIFSNGVPKTFNGLRIKSKKGGNTRSSTYRHKSGYMCNQNTPGVVNSTKLKGNVWKYSVGRNGTTKDAFAFDHPAMFPERLAADHILTWSNEGDTILDPFMGSGTTGKVANGLKREFIGFELNPAYYDISVKRVLVPYVYTEEKEE